MAIAVFALLTILLLAMALVPFLPVAHGLARIGDFPRQQFLVAGLVLAAASFVFSDLSVSWLLVQAGLLAACGINLWHILPFTPLWRKQTATFDPGREDGAPLRLIASNVKMSNRRYELLTDLIAARSPDIFVLMEVDAGWAEAFAPVLEKYPHVVSHPLENSYGMIMASRLALSDVAVDYLLTEGVPSIICTVTTQDDTRFRLYCIHPEPPVPHRETTGRDGETALVAFRAREEEQPVLVTGDLNDVAWSKTTRRFRRISRLLDPRIGRRIFSTFDARYPLMRWPLDHLFHSAEFRLRHLERLPACGSDHFPVQFDFVLCRRPECESRPEKADGEDFDRARELVGDARKRDDKPIGTDWES